MGGSSCRGLCSSLDMSSVLASAACATKGRGSTSASPSGLMCRSAAGRGAGAGISAGKPSFRDPLPCREPLPPRLLDTPAAPPLAFSFSLCSKLLGRPLGVIRAGFASCLRMMGGDWSGAEVPGFRVSVSTGLLTSVPSLRGFATSSFAGLLFLSSRRFCSSRYLKPPFWRPPSSPPLTPVFCSSVAPLLPASNVSSTSRLEARASSLCLARCFHEGCAAALTALALASASTSSLQSLESRSNFSPASASNDRKSGSSMAGVEAFGFPAGFLGEGRGFRLRGGLLTPIRAAAALTCFAGARRILVRGLRTIIRVSSGPRGDFL
mmetsp:Transcript_432/g.1126  ORF Transcript_432/g.1126 Transcript_432/m.1126 type:complete len:323 (+) Transcript_432:225-1193(+)